MLTKWNQEISRLRASVSFCVRTNVCTWATIIKDEETDGMASCRYVQIIYAILFLALSLLIMIVTRVQTFV